jgi:hypothetical protein
MSDLLTDEASCFRDIPYLVRLWINTIYIRDINQLASHDACMNAFRDAGIYVLVRLDGYLTPAVEMTSSRKYLDYTFHDTLKGTIDIFQRYPNTLGFLIVIPEKDSIMPYKKSLVGEMKDHIEEKSYMKIPVGGALSQDHFVDRAVADYLNCGEARHSADFVALAFLFTEELGCDNMIEMLQTKLVVDWRGYSIPSYCQPPPGALSSWLRIVAYRDRQLN